MKKLRPYIFILSIIVYLLSTSATMAQSTFALDAKHADQGVVTLNYSLDDNHKKIKVMVQKDGTSLYYNLSGGKNSETFPLQMGDGKYTVAVFENITGSQYRMITQETVVSTQKDPLNVYLQSTQIVKWDRRDEAIQKAKELTQDIDSDEEKVKIIYEYIVQNFKFDFDKLDKLSYDYLPDIDEMEQSKKGICYDFSALFASMLRSVGIPTKLVKGYANEIEGYHAWNEVYLNGKWMVIDTSTDAQIYANSRGSTTDAPTSVKGRTGSVDAQMSANSRPGSQPPVPDSIFKDIGNYKKVSEF